MKTFQPIVAALLLSGCFSSDVAITLRPDGSGRMTQTMVFRPSGMTEFRALFPQVQPGTTQPFGTVWAAELDRGARDQGLTVVKTSRANAPDRLTLTTEYAFTDIRQLPIDLLPPTPVALTGFLPSVGPARLRLTSTLTRTAEGHRLLTVRFPRVALDPLAEPPGAWAVGGPQEMAQFKRALDGARVTISVQTETPLLRSNSPYRENNRVVLFDVDAPEAFFSKQIDMLRATPASFDELLRMLGDLPGVRIAPDHDVTLEFEDAAPPAPQVQAPPDTEIFLAPLTRTDGRFGLGPAIDITHNPGYDNQPSFTPDGSSILFASGRGGEGQTPAPTDIYRYDIGPARTVRVTSTPESEYSPTVMPDGRRISFVRVEPDRTQRLWSVGLDGGAPALVFPDIKPVGYHAWIDARTAALFVLGADGAPSTLQVADVASGKGVVVARDIGRSLQRMPLGHVSFVQRGPRDGDRVPLTIMRLFSVSEGRPVAGTAAIVAPVPGSIEPYPVWLADGTALMAHGDVLYSWRPGDSEWTVVAPLTAGRGRNVSRLAVSPSGNWIAFVAEAAR